MPIDRSILDHLKNNNPTLTVLDLSHQEINNSDLQLLVEASTSNTIFKSIDLSDNQVDNDGVKIITKNASITSLTLNRNKINDEGAKFLAQSTFLNSLALGANEITDEGVKMLAQSTSLTALTLFCNQISNIGAKILSKSASLTKLDVGTNSITDAGVKDLLQNIGFISLDLYSTSISIETIRALNQNITLLSVNLGNCMIGDEGAKIISQNSTLNSIHLYNCGITDEGAKALAKNSTLIQLHIWGNKISSEWQDKLKEIIRCNQQALINRQDNFIQSMVILARESINPDGVSNWYKLPQEIVLHIVSFFNFSSLAKSNKQGLGCARFLFQNIRDINEILNQGHSLKIIEKGSISNPYFRFFKPQNATDSNINSRKINKITTDNPQKKQKRLPI